MNKQVFFSQDNFSMISQLITDNIKNKFGKNLYFDNINFNEYLTEIVIQSMTKVFKENIDIKTLDKEVISIVLPLITIYVNKNIQFIQKPTLKNNIRLPNQKVDTTIPVTEPKNYLSYPTRMMEQNVPRDSIINNRPNVFMDLRPPQDPYQKNDKQTVNVNFDRIAKDRQCIVNQVPEIPVFKQDFEEDNGDIMSKFEQMKNRDVFLQIPPTPSQELKFKEMINNDDYGNQMDKYNKYMESQQLMNEDRLEVYNSQKNDVKQIGQIRQEQLENSVTQWSNNNTHSFMKNQEDASSERLFQDESFRKNNNMYNREYLTKTHEL